MPCAAFSGEKQDEMMRDDQKRCAQGDDDFGLEAGLIPRRSKQPLVPQNHGDLRVQTLPYEGPTPAYEGPGASGLFFQPIDCGLRSLRTAWVAQVARESC